VCDVRTAVRMRHCKADKAGDAEWLKTELSLMGNLLDEKGNRLDKHPTEPLLTLTKMPKYCL
jgi:hypothetical protein